MQNQPSQALCFSSQGPNIMIVIIITEVILHIWKQNTAFIKIIITAIFINQVLLLVMILAKFSWDCVVYHRTGQTNIIFGNNCSTSLPLRSTAMGGSKALLERPRNLASPLDKLNLVDFYLILRHYLQSLQYDPKPPRSKRVRCLHLNTLQF